MNGNILTVCASQGESPNQYHFAPSLALDLAVPRRCRSDVLEPAHQWPADSNAGRPIQLVCNNCCGDGLDQLRQRDDGRCHRFQWRAAHHQRRPRAAQLRTAATRHRCPRPEHVQPVDACDCCRHGRAGVCSSGACKQAVCIARVAILESSLFQQACKTCFCCYVVYPLQCTPQQCLPYTVFAPNNAAFAKLPTSVLANLLANPAQLAQVLKYHLLPSRVYSTQIVNGAKVRAVPRLRVIPACTDLCHSLQALTLDNQNVSFSITGGKVLVNGATVLAADVQVNASRLCSSGLLVLEQPTPASCFTVPVSLSSGSERRRAHHRHGAHPIRHLLRPAYISISDPVAPDTLKGADGQRACPDTLRVRGGKVKTQPCCILRDHTPLSFIAALARSPCSALWMPRSSRWDPTSWTTSRTASIQ